MKPIIGVIEWPYLDKDGDYIYEIPTQIVEWIIRSGGRPLGIFPSNIEQFYDKKLTEIPPLTEIEHKDLVESVSLCDAIIKPGGNKTYNHERIFHI